MIDKFNEQKQKVTIDGIVCCNVDDSLINNNKNFDSKIFKQFIDGLWTNAIKEKKQRRKFETKMFGN